VSTPVQEVGKPFLDTEQSVIGKPSVPKEKTPKGKHHRRFEEDLRGKTIL
jgi:hypothetical protein